MIVSIAKIHASNAKYYVEHAIEEGGSIVGDEHSRWRGSPAEELSLSGEVSAGDLTAALKGRSKRGDPLVRNAGSENRQAGWDLCWSVNKSVSLLWAFSPRLRQQVIESLVFEVVNDVLEIAEEKLFYSRIGAGGKQQVSAQVIRAEFMHFASRAGDPQLHVHVLIPNLARRPDGSWGALVSRELYRCQKMLGALAAAELAYRIENVLGIQVTGALNGFEVAGLPQGMAESFSTRRAEILTEMADAGVSGGKAASISARKTRSQKSSKPLISLIEEWKVAAKPFGGASSVRDSPKPARRISKKRRAGILPYLIARRCAIDLAERHGVFTEDQLIREVARRIWFGKSPVQSVIESVKAVTNRGWIIRVTEGRYQPAFTTKAILKAEDRVIKKIKGSKAENMSHSKPWLVEKILNRPASLVLEKDQREAVKWITAAGGSIKCITGPPGAGKNLVLRAAMKYWRLGLRSVIGCAQSGMAARQLEEGTGIESMTVRKLLTEFRKATLWKAFMRPVVVVDEANMVGTRDFLELINQTLRFRGTVIAIGDIDQLHSIHSGGVFERMVGELGAAELESSRRQFEHWMASAARQAKEGDVAGCFSQYAHAERLHIEPTDEEARKSLVKKWMALRAEDERNSGVKVIAQKKSEALRLNAQIQAARRENREIGLFSGRFGDSKFHRGDEVVFVSNSKKYEIRNGDVGTIERVRVDPLGRLIRVKVRLQNGKKSRAITFNPRKGPAIELGYCLTTFKAEGPVFDKCLVYLNGYQSRQNLHVQLTRSREETHIYSSSETVGRDLEHLAWAVSFDETKRLARTRIEELEKSKRRKL